MQTSDISMGKVVIGNYTMTNRKFLSCKWLEHGIIFDHENILRVCCSQCNEGGGRPVLRGQFYGGSLDWGGIFAQKREMRQFQRRGEVYPSCKGCVLLKEDEWDDEDYIGMLLLTHWIDCNCRCIYCPAVSDEDLKKRNKHYNIVPVLQDLCDKKLLKKDAYISIAGGESTIYPEFEDMLHLLLDYGCNNILINSSGIKFSPAIAKGLEERKLQLTVSVDSGCRETYEKLKLVPTYEKVCENLIKYGIAQGEDHNRVCSKYIIVPGYNDNAKEIDMWLHNTKLQGLKHVSIDVDWRWVQKNLKHLKKEKNIYRLIVHTTEAAEKEELIIRYDERAAIMRRTYRQPKSVFSDFIKKIFKG